MEIVRNRGEAFVMVENKTLPDLERGYKILAQ